MYPITSTREAEVTPERRGIEHYLASYLLGIQQPHDRVAIEGYQLSAQQEETVYPLLSEYEGELMPPSLLRVSSTLYEQRDEVGQGLQSRVSAPEEGVGTLIP